MSVDTRIERFLRSHGIRPAHVAREAGCSRKHLFKIRMGIAEPTRPVMRAITCAVAMLIGRKVRASELFRLGDGER